MFKKIWNLYQKNKEIIHYLIFGVLTTIVNFVVYFICANLGGIDEIISNVISWLISVLFAYVTNKIFVFESKTSGIAEIVKEFSSFVVCRVLSGILDTGLFALMVKVFGWNDYIAKAITQVLVVIANYVFSKLFIFKKKEN